MIKIYFLFVVGEGKFNFSGHRIAPVKAVIATTDYETHCGLRVSWIQRGCKVSTKDKDMTIEQWESIKDIF